MSGHWVLMSVFAEDSLENGRILSLHPAVSQELSARGIPYKIFHDYCSEERLRSDEGEFFKEQLLWLKQLDEFIERQIPGAEGVKGLGEIHINRLKYLIDFVIIQARYLKSFLDREKPVKVILVEHGWSEDEFLSIYDFKHPLRLSLGALLQHEAPSRGFSLEIKKHPLLKPGLPEKQAVLSGSKLKNLAVRVGAKNWLERIRYRSFFPAVKTPWRLVFLFLDAGTETFDFLIREALRRGRVFIKQDLIVREPGRKKTYSLSAPDHTDKADDKAWLSFQNGPLMAWVERYAPGCREILKPYLRHFFSRQLPAVLSEMRKIKRFMRDEDVHVVISRASAGSNYPAALLAARRMGVPRVCFQHSIGPLDMPDWAADELGFCDLNFAMHPISRDYFRTYPPFFNNACRVESWSYALRQRAKTAKKKKAGREVIFYVPAKLAGGAAHFNTPIYPMTWYFEHQKKILSYFSQRPEFHFVYKHSALQHWAGASVLAWLAEQDYPNIEVAEGPFPKLMRKADRVIFDYPSSGTFESAAAGIPMLALHHKSMRVWEPMREFFGSILTSFSDSEQAVTGIHEFLNSPPEKYLKALPVEKREDPFALMDVFIKLFGGGRV